MVYTTINVDEGNAAIKDPLPLTALGRKSPTQNPLNHTARYREKRPPSFFLNFSGEKYGLPNGAVWLKRCSETRF